VLVIISLLPYQTRIFDESLKYKSFPKQTRRMRGYDKTCEPRLGSRVALVIWKGCAPIRLHIPCQIQCTYRLRRATHCAPIIL